MHIKNRKKQFTRNEIIKIKWYILKYLYRQVSKSELELETVRAKNAELTSETEYVNSKDNRGEMVQKY